MGRTKDELEKESKGRNCHMPSKTIWIQEKSGGMICNNVIYMVERMIWDERGEKVWGGGRGKVGRRERETLPGKRAARRMCKEQGTHEWVGVEEGGGGRGREGGEWHNCEDG